MDLTLTIEEATDLLTALRIRLLEMRGELARTDDRAYRVDLRTSLERLEGVEQELASMLVDPTGRGVPARL